MADLITDPITDWDAAYHNGALEADPAAIFADWAARAAAFRAVARGDRDIAYGAHPRETYDLFLPEAAPKGLMVFIHGGYWKAMDKEHSSHFSAGALARGWAAAVLGYPLCPEARIAAISRSVARAVEAAAARVPGPVALTGHSAGGHLAARMLCADAPLSAETAARIVRAASLSGVHDLRPLMRTAMNAVLRLDEAEATAESPALLRPRPGARLLAYVGADELPEFRRQNALIANIWTGLGADCAAQEAHGLRHFGVVEGLCAGDSGLTRWLTA